MQKIKNLIQIYPEPIRAFTSALLFFCIVPVLMLGATHGYFITGILSISFFLLSSIWILSVPILIRYFRKKPFKKNFISVSLSILWVGPTIVILSLFLSSTGKPDMILFAFMANITISILTTEALEISSLKDKGKNSDNLKKEIESPFANKNNSLKEQPHINAISKFKLILGRVLPIVLLGVFIFSIIKDEQKLSLQKNSDESLKQELVQIANNLASQLPQRLDKQTEATSVAAVGKTLVFYRTLNIKKDSLNLKVFNREMSRYFHKAACGPSDLQEFIKLGAAIAYIYHDVDGNFIAKFKYDKKSCEANKPNN